MNRRVLLSYVGPVIVSLSVMPQIASAGSVRNTSSTAEADTATEAELCVDGPMPAHGCKKYLRRHRFD